MNAPTRTLTVLAEQALAKVPGGTGRYTLQLIRAMAAQAPAGWRVRTVTAWHRAGGGRDAIVAELGTAPPSTLLVPGRALPVLWRRGAPPWPSGDSVHAATPLAPRRRRRPLVVTVHDLVAFTHPQLLTPHGAAWHRAMIDRAAASADAVVVPTRAVADELTDRYSLGDRVVVIPHGVTAMPVPGDARQRLRALGLPTEAEPTEPYVLFLGTLEPRKGVDVLIAAMADVRLAGVHLVLLGPAGWGGVDPAALADAAGMDRRRLHVLGGRGDADIAAVLSGAAVVAVPSRTEGFGLPVLEAMAAGVPVVHSTAPALLEVAGGAGCAVSVDDVTAWADALARVVGDEGLARRLAATGRTRARAFSWSRSAQRTWQVHLSLI